MIGSDDEDDLADILTADDEELERELAEMRLERTGPTVSLVLQGSGLAGAYSWGVLETLYTQSTLRIGAISAAGTAALTALAFIDGIGEGDPDAPLENMKVTWELLQDRMRGRDGIWAGPLAAMRATLGDASVPSPYISSAELVETISRVFRFDRLEDAGIPLFLAATNAETGRMRVFSGMELGSESFAAAIAEPLIMEPVLVDGVPHWEGAYTGSPAIFPLISEGAEDIVMVLAIPDTRTDLGPDLSSRRDRVTEIACLSGLSREMRAMWFLSSLVEDGSVSEKDFHRPNLHMIRISTELSARDLFDVSPAWVAKMREQGQKDTERWLDADGELVGRTSTIDQRELFL